MIRIRFLAVFAACLLLAMPVAAPAQDPHPAPPPPPLKPGQSAGVHAAQQGHTGLALVGSGAIIAVVIVAATAGNGGNASSQISPQAFQSVATTS